MKTDTLFNALAYALQQFCEELQSEEAEARQAPRNDVAYYTTQNIRQRLEEIMRVHSATKALVKAKHTPEAR